MNNSGKNILYYIKHGIILVSAAVLTQGCSSGKEMSEIQSSEMEIAEAYLGSFPAIWQKKTVKLVSSGEGASLLNQPNIGGGQGRGNAGQERGARGINGQATLIDSALVETGITEFAQLASLSTEEKVSYKKNYISNNKTDKYITIWLELKTSYTKEVLDIKNWNFFLEDEKRNQLEPVEITEAPIRQVDNNDRFGFDRPEGNGYWSVSSKTLVLRFNCGTQTPLKFIPGAKNIKIVMYNWNEQTRLEGIINN